MSATEDTPDHGCEARRGSVTEGEPHLQSPTTDTERGVEAVARAIAKAVGVTWTDKIVSYGAEPVPFENPTDRYFAQARAAIAALSQLSTPEGGSQPDQDALPRVGLPRSGSQPCSEGGEDA